VDIETISRNYLEEIEIILENLKEVNGMNALDNLQKIKKLS
jgi:hypothetical protein